MVERLSFAPSTRAQLGVAVCGPAKATRLLQMPGDEIEDWLAEARSAAILGSCPRSKAELKSSLRAYAAFALKVRQPALPPTTDLLLSWSCLFRCSGTFTNYLSHLRTACQLAGISTEALHSRLLTKACRAIDKRRGYTPRQPMFIGFELVRRMVEQAASCPRPGARALAMAFLTAYIFLLRMPSECLPIRIASQSTSDEHQQAVLSVSQESVTLRLKRRKNKEGGSLLTRRCWCSKCEATCPVHVLGKFCLEAGARSAPFANFSPAGVLAALRRWLTCLGVPDATKYRTHDIRRGHARDLQLAGSSLMEILKAGEWRSAAFLAYLDKGELECSATLEAHLNESSDEEVER
jgi:hypothetical protein